MGRFRVNSILQQISLEIEDAEPMHVCLGCFDDERLKARSSRLMKPRQCAFCGATTESAITPASIVEIIRAPLQLHFITEWGETSGPKKSLPEIVAEGIKSSSATLCQTLADLLEDPEAEAKSFYSPRQMYCAAPDRFQSEEEGKLWAEAEWRAISTHLIHGKRFFNEQARNFFESLVAETMFGARGKLSRSPALSEIAVGQKFYRARILKSPQESKMVLAKPMDELGAPPKDRAANNRMSATGVQLLYVASDAKTAIAEVRPSIGDKLAVGEFTSTEELRVFDLTVLDNLEHEPLGLLHQSYEMRTAKRLLLKHIHDLIARPVRANDTDYVMTQAFAEHIRYCGHNFDGIAFRSVQRSGDGINYVFFDKNSSEDMHGPDWRPTFSFRITECDVSIHEVKGVNYDAPLVT
ncbi:RES family NAD+ phosphorylase [Pseudomonas viridiflava]|nr:RES family NAD+ phosphorylase [Pseudomonas viridiflava]